MTATRNRSLDLHRLIVVLIFIAAVFGFYRTWETEQDSTDFTSLTNFTKKLTLASGPAVYRTDGGQALGPGGTLEPNALTRLNLGLRLELATTHPYLLATLPGLGDKSAITTQSKGCLTAKARKRLEGLVKESCNPNSL